MQIGRSISGLIVTHAEKVLRKKEENFIINLAKFTGLNFVHCLTDAPTFISKDLAKILDSLMVNNVELFPRFHERVKVEVAFCWISLSHEIKNKSRIKIPKKNSMGLKNSGISVKS